MRREFVPVRQPAQVNDAPYAGVASRPCEIRGNILVAAVKAAELVDTLTGAGPFTVFAPSDEAFSSIRRRPWKAAESPSRP